MKKLWGYDPSKFTETKLEETFIELLSDEKIPHTSGKVITAVERITWAGTWHLGGAAPKAIISCYLILQPPKPFQPPIRLPVHPAARSGKA